MATFFWGAAHEGVSSGFASGEVRLEDNPGRPAQKIEEDVEASVRIDLVDFGHEIRESAADDANAVTCGKTLLERAKDARGIAARHQPCDHSTGHDSRALLAKSDDPRDPIAALDLAPERPPRVKPHKDIAGKDRPEIAEKTSAPAPSAFLERQEDFATQPPQRPFGDMMLIRFAEHEMPLQGHQIILENLLHRHPRVHS